jgi:arsenate reductase-like glutaredoxin family protein
VDARKETIKEKAASKLINSFNIIIVGKGKKIVEFKLPPDNKKDIMKAIIGRTGNLRAPAVQSGGRLYIGFNDDIYNDLS